MRRVGRNAFDCFLMKPLDPRDLVAEVEARIGHPPTATTSYPVPESE